MSSVPECSLSEYIELLFLDVGAPRIFTNLSKDHHFFALRVPSTIVELESNIIPNPLYKNFHKVKITEFIELRVDGRFGKIY